MIASATTSGRSRWTLRPARATRTAGQAMADRGRSHLLQLAQCIEYFRELRDQVVAGRPLDAELIGETMRHYATY